MPLPWKKSKVTRISRLVADLHQSPKRGGSLVVETGFPTSLVDLFVKNKDRLKKSSKKKSPPYYEIPTPPRPPFPPSPPPVKSSRTPLPPPPTPPLARGEQKEVHEEKRYAGASGSHTDGVQEEDDEERKGRILFVEVLKIFMVVVLALSTKSFAMGIMIAAFLLLLMESHGRLFFCSLKPCSQLRSGFLGSWIQKALLILKSWEDATGELTVQEDDSADPCDMIELKQGNCFQEIELIELTSQFDAPKGKTIQPRKEREIIEMGTRAEVVKEKEETIGVLISRSEHKRSAKLKSKLIKKLVPKKLRNGKKERKSNQLGAEKLGEIVEEENCEEVEEIVGEICKGIKEIGHRISSSSGPLLWIEKETAVVKQESQCKEREGNSDYLFLIGVVLAGLMGGRLFAFGLTVAWCLFLRLNGKPRKCTETVMPSPTTTDSS